MLDIIIPVLRLLGLTVAGALVFRVRAVRENVLTPLVFVTINILFPIYFISNFAPNWESAAEVGPVWLIISALSCALMMMLQAAFGKALVGRRWGIPTDHPREVTALSAIHNAGYIPIPIMTAISPGPVLIYVFFYTLGFNLIFWTLAVDYISGARRKPIIKLNPPTIGILLGILLAATGWYWELPTALRAVLEPAGDVGLDLVLFVLGGVLVRVSGESHVDRTVWWKFVAWRQIAYPAGVVLLLVLAAPLYLEYLPGGLRFAIPVAVVLQATSPPATNLAIVAEAYGTHEQTQVIARGVVVSYIAAVITIPLFLGLTTLFFAEG
ncbi:MAG: AEC family transporter [Spirochaetales bacterium]